jgi:hypothetical protein
VATDDSGNAIYCCTPTCEVHEARCGSGSTTYECSGSARPEDTDTSTSCAQILSYWGFSEYCCAPQNECFVGPEDYNLIANCYADEVILCSGDAVPPTEGRTCVEGPVADLRTFCCTPSVDGGVSDGGAVDADAE